jgi:hypothetical protein
VSELTTRAVGDGESGGLGDGVGLAGVSDLSCLGAVCGESGDNLGHVGGSSAVLGSVHLNGGGGKASHRGGSNSSGETHVDIRCLVGVI